MDNFELLERLGAVEPPDLTVTARVAAALEGAGSKGAGHKGILSHSLRLRRRHILLVIFAVIVIVVAAVSLLFTGSGLTSPITTAWQPGHAVPIGSGRSTSHSLHGTWVLLDDVLTGTWQQDVSGPPPGYFTCPDTSTCFAMSGNYPNTEVSARSDSLYASNDFGSTWTDFPMPSGFLSTTALVCSDATDCAAGGTYNSQPVLVKTSDGGHSFAIDPLPAAVGTIYSLSCPSSQFCAGLVSKNADANLVPEDATLLTTSDGGVQFSDSSIVAGDSMEQIACPSDVDCTTIGVGDAQGINDWTSGVSAVTTDGGLTWSAGMFPVGFGVNYLSKISCADAQHCSAIGNIEMPIANSPACATIKPSLPPSSPGTPPEQSPAVAAISKLEYQYAMAAYRGASSKIVTCQSGGNGETEITDIASTSNGGRTWTPEPLPSDVPQPQLTGISCPSDSECWASGSTAIPERVGSGYNAGSSVLLGTTDDGASWSMVIFSVPSGSPNFNGQSFLSAGFISCPSVNDCAANGSGAQSAPSAPIYTLRVPGNEN